MNTEYQKSETVCFSGHRNIPAFELGSLKQRIQEAVRTAYNSGYRVFICGGARGFDTLAALEVLKHRSGHPDTRLVIAVPCLQQADRWPEKDRKIYRSILGQADEKVILSDFYYSGCMQNRNRYMVDSASLCICYMTRFEGGTWSTVRYAMRSALLVQNLAMPPGKGSTFKETSWNCTYTSPSVQENASIVLLSHSRRLKNRRTHISTLYCRKQKQEKQR